MKSSIISLALVSLIFGGMYSVAAPQTEVPTVAIPKVSAWKTPDKLSQQLAAELTKRLDGLEAKKMRDFIKNDDNLRLLLMYYFAQQEAGRVEANKNFNQNLTQSILRKKDDIARLEKEVNDKSGSEKENARYRLSCAKTDLKKLQAESRHPIDLGKCEKVLKSILADAEWMEQIAFSGEMDKFARVVQIIDSIAADDAKALKKGVARDTTTALALEYARYDIKTVDAIDRARYYLKYWRQGRLNASFDDLPLHHRRVACGWKPNHRAGTVTAFEWALNNVHLPDWQYPASCWRCGYILDNVYGDSIHGAHYFAPWEGVWTDNHMVLTKYVGGVCGGLSHFGAAAACANGVPALTNGEPGHCAYIVLVNGHWTPAYSLSWERGLHWTPWEGNHTFSALHLADALYDKKNEAKTRLSNAYRILGTMYRQKKDIDKALTCYERAAKAAPLNYAMWREYTAFLKDSFPKQPAAWEKLNSRLCRGMAGEFPEQAAELLKRGVLNGMADSGMSADDLMDACALFWKKAERMGPDRWYVENFADAQLQACKKQGGDTESTLMTFYLNVLKAAAPHDAYSGTMMSWGNRMAGSLSEDGQKKLREMMIQTLADSKDLDSAQRARMLGGFVLAAEKSRDTGTFYSISKMIDPKEIHGSAEIPEIVPFAGKLVSEGGLPFASSTSQWDEPHTHSGLLTRKGGRIHTARENNPWIAVKLPKHAFVTGVVLAGTNDWKLIGRFRPVKVQVSDTGRDDDWHDVGEPIPNTGNYIIRFNLEKERPKALYVRVLRPGGPEVFHANGLYVFGEPAA